MQKDDMDIETEKPEIAFPGWVRKARPFEATNAGHLVSQVAEELKWNLDDLSKFIKRAQHVEFGLDAEVEFAAVISWLGKCRLVHRLDQKRFSSFDDTDAGIPDLFSVFENDSSQFKCLIEVKTKRSDTLCFKKEYLDGLQQYANLAGHPLLIAWKLHKLGIWVLFDPAIAKDTNGKLVVEWDEAHKHNLLGGLAGDFAVSPFSGTKMTIECHRISEKEPHDNGYAANFAVMNVSFLDCNGNELPNVPAAILAILFTAVEYSETIDDDRFVMEFKSTALLTYAQSILRTVVGIHKNDDEKIHWNAVATDLDSILSRDDLLGAVQKFIGVTIRNLLYVHPPSWPNTIPDANRIKPQPPSF